MSDDKPPKMDKMITVRMDSELYERVMAKAHAKGRGFSLSAHIRDSLVRWVDKP